MKEQKQSKVVVVLTFIRQRRINKEQVFLFGFLERLGRISSCVRPVKFGKATNVLM